MIEQRTNLVSRLIMIGNLGIDFCCCFALWCACGRPWWAVAWLLVLVARYVVPWAPENLWMMVGKPGSGTRPIANANPTNTNKCGGLRVSGRWWRQEAHTSMCMRHVGAGK